MEVDMIVDLNSDNENEISSDKPIIKLFKLLIYSENKQMTLLTNAKIIAILEQELDYDIKNLHELQEEIYLTVIKKCLKDWPGWDNFAKFVNKYKDKPNLLTDNMLEDSYKNLKSYLANAINVATPLANKALENFKKTTGATKIQNPESDVVLEINATRAQLNHMFFRYPNGKLNNTIFNCTPAVPSQIRVTTLSLQSILNWWDVNLYILSPTSQLNQYIYKRETNHQFKHVLVNKKLRKQPTPPTELNQQLQLEGTKSTLVKSIEYKDIIKQIRNYYSNTVDNIDEVLDFVIKEITMLPPDVFSMKNYRRYTNKYPYDRYLFQDIENESSDVTNTYDIQLEETIMPAYKFYLGSIDVLKEKLQQAIFVKNPIFIDCKSCNASFSGKDVVNNIKMHFETYHQPEVDFKCTNCKKEFAIEALTQNWWCHKC